MSDKPNVVLVHGAWADGSSWSAVIESLQAKGYAVTAPQFAETSLANDVARLRQVLVRQNGPTVVAGHSYGGHIMTALGSEHPNVAALVYIAAFGLDQGESPRRPPREWAANAGAGAAQGRARLRLAAPRGLRGALRRRRRSGEGNVMYAVQQPISLSTFEDVMGEPAWKSLPSWYLVATNDEAIPPDAERSFAKRMGATTIEVPASHVAMVSQPNEVVQLIEAAAAAIGGAANEQLVGSAQRQA